MTDFLQEELTSIVFKLEPDFFKSNNLEILPNHGKTSVSLPLEGQPEKPRICLGVKDKTIDILTGEIAHEIAEIKLGPEKLHERFYFKMIYKLTKNTRIASKISYSIALVNGLILKNESEADRLAAELLKEAQLAPSKLIASLENVLEFYSNRKGLNALLLRRITEIRIKRVRKYELV